MLGIEADRIDVGSLKTRSGRSPSQNAIELAAFVDFLERQRVRSYLEIGARNGDTYFHVMTHLPKRSHGVAVDLPGGKWGSKRSYPDLERASLELKQRGYFSRLLIGNSGKAWIIKRVKRYGPYDAILIDGDHRYEGVKRDWDNYGPLGRFVAFHDIAGEGQTTKTDEALPVEVPRLWAEIQKAETCVEFIAPGSKMGIGVVIR